MAAGRADAVGAALGVHCGSYTLGDRTLRATLTPLLQQFEHLRRSQPGFLLMAPPSPPASLAQHLAKEGASSAVRRMSTQSARPVLSFFFAVWLRQTLKNADDKINPCRDLVFHSGSQGERSYLVAADLVGRMACGVNLVDCVEAVVSEGHVHEVRLHEG